MAGIDKEKRKATANKRNMTNAFESYRFLLYEKLEGAAHIIHLINKEAAMFGVEEEYRVKFMDEKLLEMKEQIEEQRKLESKKRSRK